VSNKPLQRTGFAAAERWRWADRGATMQTEYCCLKCKHRFDIVVTESESAARLLNARVVRPQTRRNSSESMGEPG